jgi:hypothetical protein
MKPDLPSREQQVCAAIRKNFQWMIVHEVPLLNRVRMWPRIFFPAPGDQFVWKIGGNVLM